MSAVDKEAPELLPCPLCGSEEAYTDTGSDCANMPNAGCMECGLHLNARTIAEAITAWNRRAHPAAPAEVEGVVDEDAAAKIIFSAMIWAATAATKPTPDEVTWVEFGNSYAQEVARKAARYATAAALTALQARVQGLVNAANDVLRYKMDGIEAEIGRECRDRDIPIAYRRLMRALARLDQPKGGKGKV